MYEGYKVPGRIKNFTAYFIILQPPDRFTLTAANYRLASSNKKSQQFSGRSSSAGTGNTPSGIGNLTSGSSGAPTYTIR